MSSPTMRVRIDGELYTVKEVTRYADPRSPSLPEVVMESGEQLFLAESREAAGEAARKRWEDMAQDDPKEFACMVGEETLVKWGMGHFAGPGSTPVKSLQDWLDLWLDTPEEEFASYDGTERDVERCGRLADDLGFTPTVAYRHN